MVVDLFPYSAFLSATRSEPYTHGHPEPPRARHFHEAPPIMAAATLLNPASGYHPHSQPFSSPYHQPPPPPATTNMISPNDGKRLSSDIDNGPRQSLPSISEVFSAGKPSHYAPSTPTTLASSQSLPPPFVSVGPPPQQRPEPGPEPRPLPPHEEKYFPFPSRHDSNPSQVGPPSSYSFSGHSEMSKAPEPTPSSSHLNSQPPPSIQYPPGQLALNATPATTRHHPPLPSYEAHRAPPPPRADEDYGMHRARYDTTLNRHFEAWGYADCLGKVRDSETFDVHRSLTGCLDRLEC